MAFSIWDGVILLILTNWGMRLKSGPTERQLGFLVDEQLHTGHQCVLTESQLNPGLNPKSSDQKVKGGDSPSLLL